MVGFQQNDNLTQSQKYSAGWISGVITRLITQPIEVIKLRVQLQKTRHAKEISVLAMSRRIIHEEGFKAFYHGHSTGQIQSVLAVSTQFYIYELTTKKAAKSGIRVIEENKRAVEFFCGILAGCCTAAVALPLEVIRVRQMIVQEQYRGLWNGAKSVYNAGGILAFYEGLSASLLQYGPAVGVSFSVFRLTQPLMLSLLSRGPVNDASLNNTYKYSHVALASVVAGSVAGFVSKTVTYPLDLVKRRLQIRTHIQDERYPTPSTARNLMRCTKFLACVHKIVRKNGVKGLFQGWAVTVVKSQLTSVVAFTTYESACYLIRQYNIS